jgi:predicted peptidase
MVRLRGYLRWLLIIMGAASVAPLASAAGVDARVEWVTRAVTAPRVTQQTFQSTAVGRLVSYHLYVPAAYDTDAARRFPVVYWLHGSGGGLPGIETGFRGTLGPLLPSETCDAHGVLARCWYHSPWLPPCRPARRA